ncbi:hypothetical protein BDV32DRAFT_118104 [Aspergillus pseudonomiae]|nr:hypothetical protein BDV32DRAFT_118104 [Aspergillus pseudonomiae]
MRKIFFFFLQGASLFTDVTLLSPYASCAPNVSNGRRELQDPHRNSRSKDIINTYKHTVPCIIPAPIVLPIFDGSTFKSMYDNQ